MSAIAGIVNFGCALVEVDDLHRIARALRPYGPDRTDVAVAGPVGFVNVLMRMTPEDQFDRQPLRSTDAGGPMITADLRLDNRDDLLAHIGVRTADAEKWADSRVLLAAWEKLGDNVWPLLRGPFVAAVWEPQKGKLTLARDHLGLNVVMWYRNAQSFVFATMPRGIFAFRKVPRRINEEKFADFLVLNHADYATTVYREVFRVAPAHCLIARIDGTIEQRRYWSAANIKPIRLSSDDEYAEGLLNIMRLAVRRQMRGAHSIGCLLSGGLDSSSVAAIAARLYREQGSRLSAFTQIPRQGFDGPVPAGCYADESPYVDAIASAMGNIDVTYVRNDRCDDFSNLERMFSALDGPVRNPMNLGWILKIADLASTAGKRILLTGRHGNFSISWDGWSQSADHLRCGRLWKAYKQLLLFYSCTDLTMWQACRILLLDPLAPRKVTEWISRYGKHREAPAWRSHSPIRPEFAKLIGIERRAAVVGQDLIAHRYSNDRRGATALTDFEGEWTQAIKALTGVEIRDPTADLDVVTYCLAIPSEQFLAEGVDRSLIRRAMWGLLPEMVLTKRSRGVQSADWYEKLTQRRFDLAKELTHLTGSLHVRQFIDVKRLSQSLADWPDGGWNTTKVIKEYRLLLPRGIAAARFLAWIESKDHGDQY